MPGDIQISRIVELAERVESAESTLDEALYLIMEDPVMARLYRKEAKKMAVILRQLDAFRSRLGRRQLK